MIDVGTGAGFPGIPLKIIRPDIEMTLVDSLQKRITFLEEIINKLGMTQISAIHARAEEIGKDENHREKYDCVTSRAVANLTTLVEYMIPLCKIKGKTICMKGSNIADELEEAQKAIKILEGKIENTESFTLPQTDIARNIIIIEKEKSTPKQYPRKAGTPAKQPLV